ncbi:MAG: hypothetical protein KGL95_08115, partial [Patescibacteria group bacterium]|nr:hypothetical protein [Patescibacteria group bacterium]
MDDDDWRNWKDGRYDNRYHGVRRRSGKRYYGRGKSRALQIVIISIGLVAVSLFVLVVGVPGLPQISIPNFIETKLSQTPPVETQNQGQTSLPA